MKVKELIKILRELDQNAVVDIASDEEGNSFGEISNGVAEGFLKSTGEKVYSFYPESTEQPEERYRYDEAEIARATAELIKNSQKELKGGV